QVDNSLATLTARMHTMNATFSGAVYAAFRRVTAWFVSGGLVFAIANQIRQVTMLEKEMMDTLIDIQKVTTSSFDCRAAAFKNIIDVSLQYGETLKNVAQVELEFARQGLQGKERTDAVTSAIQLAQAASISLGDAVEFLTLSVRTFN